MKRTTQGGYMLMAFAVLVFMAAITVMVARTNRIVGTGRADATTRIRLADWLAEMKYALVFKAITEDNTPGTLPCPDSPSCSVSGDGISGTLPSTVVDLPLDSPSGVCVQYVVDPALRNFIHTEWRGGSQPVINPHFIPSLTLIDAAGNQTKLWGVLLAGPSASDGNCSLATLGYTLDTSTGWTLTPTSSTSQTTQLTLLQKKDFMRGLFMQVLRSVDTAALENYLIALDGATGIKPPYQLAIARKVDMTTEAQTFSSFAFDTTLLQPNTTLGGIKNTCYGVTQNGSSPSVEPTYKTPVSWLCFNNWYDYIQYSMTGTTPTFSLHDDDTGLTCTRSNGMTSC